MTAMTRSNEEKNDIIKIIKSLEESDLLIKKKKIKNGAKKPIKTDFSVMLLGSLGASLL